MDNSFIPVNTEGKENNLEFSKTHDTREEAIDCFKRAHKRLLNPPVWHELGGMLTAEFRLVNRSGEVAERLAQLGDFFEVDLPGPGPTAGDGYDWVEVAGIIEKTDEHAEEEMFGIRLQPAANPNNAGGDIAHFFKAGASSTFVVSRRGNTVTASYHGRNEVPNTHTEKTIDNIRNGIVATGAVVGLSEAQWSALTKALLEAEIGG